jgi:hypothetical protein
MRFCFLSQSEYSNVRISRATIFRKTKENKYYHIKIAWSKIANWIKVIEKSLELNLTTSHYHNRLLWFFFFRVLFQGLVSFWIIAWNSFYNSYRKIVHWKIKMACAIVDDTLTDIFNDLEIEVMGFVTKSQKDKTSVVHWRKLFSCLSRSQRYLIFDCFSVVVGYGKTTWRCYR